MRHKGSVSAATTWCAPAAPCLPPPKTRAASPPQVACKPRVRGIGYIRVSSERQAQEGVSLDAQKIRIQAHCVALDINLVDIVVDDVTAKSLDRPALQTALRGLSQGTADALIVFKLDRLTRSVRDWNYLLDNYFGDARPWSLLSVCDMVDTRSAAGKLNLNVILSVAQWERETISERTKEAMDELHRQGVRTGRPPYGWHYSQRTDGNGRRIIEPDPDEQHGIRRICELYDADLYVKDICEVLIAEGIPSRRQVWHRRTIYRVLERAGYEDPEGRICKSAPSQRQAQQSQGSVVRDKGLCAWRAAPLRAQGLSLRQVGDQLLAERYLPPRGNVWHAGSVLDLLRMAPAPITPAQP